MCSQAAEATRGVERVAIAPPETGYPSPGGVPGDTPQAHRRGLEPHAPYTSAYESPLCHSAGWKAIRQKILVIFFARLFLL